MLEILATWYIQYVLRWLDGPAGVFVGVRRVAGVAVDNGQLVVKRDGILADLFSCVYCLSFWVGVGVSAVSLLGVRRRLRGSDLVRPFGLAGASVVVEMIMQRLTRW